MKSTFQKQILVSIALAVLGIVFPIAAAEVTGDWRTSGGVQMFRFETSALKGRFIAGDQRELPRGYARHGLRGLVLQPSGKDPHPPTGKVGGKRRHRGMLNLYRVYSATESFGALRDEDADIEEKADGATLTWPAIDQRPATISATWKITGPAQIDLKIVVDPQRDIANFEILLANYVALDMSKGLYIERDGAPVFGETAVQGNNYGFYPLNVAARKNAANSGRFHASWKWPSFIPQDYAALPLAVAGDDAADILLMSDPQSTSAVCVTPNRRDGAPPETWTSIEQHSAMYLSFFSRDVRAGESLVAHSRLVFIKKPSNPSESHQRIYARFLEDISDASSDPAPSKSSDSKPFPQNRLRDFYKNQARRFLRGGNAIPSILPAFPGLDGGIFGHWGQNTEPSFADDQLNAVDTGGLVSQSVRYQGSITTRAITVSLGEEGEAAAVFDPERLTFTDAWQGGFVRWDSRRFGLNSGVRPAGKRLLNLSDSEWSAAPKQYLGLHRNGNRTVFHYRIGDAEVYDHAWFENGKLTRSITIDGKLPEGVSLQSNWAPKIDDGETKALALGNRPRWADSEVVTGGELGTETGPYVIDTLTIPYRDQNPFKMPFRVGGFDFLPDGRAAVCTFMGDVWLVDGIDGDLDRLNWKRFASGLHQALGLVVKDGKVLVLGRDQITRLHDRNDDGEADYYECLTSEYPTAAGNSYACTLHQDDAGTLYWFTRSERMGFTRYPEGGKPESIATGLRGSNGTGVSPNGKIRLCTVQEGRWTPASAIFEVGGGSYHGFWGPQQGQGKHGYDPPLCYIPRGIDNSSGDIAFLPDDPRLGPIAGSIIGTSWGACQHYLILREEVGGRSQGGIVPLPGDFLSGAHRSRFNPRDGHFYVAGSSGWGSYARKPGSLQRVRYTGGDLFLPREVETRENGLIVRFNDRIDPASLKLNKAFCEQWNYLYSSAYGSGEYSPRNSGRQGHDLVKIRSLTALEDGRSVFIEIPQLHPVMQLHLYLEFRTADGRKVTSDIYYSIFQLGKPFTQFAGYRAILKEPYPEFPLPEAHARDPRLVAQEKLGKSTRGFETAVVNCVPGLQFEPRRIRMRAGRRAAITLINKDVEMPHNLVLVQPGRIEAIGSASMLQAADPSAVARHYVPDDAGVMAMSPLIQPGEQYAIYFNTPKQPGEYPILCTFPGHWVIMRGILEIVD